MDSVATETFESKEPIKRKSLQDLERKITFSQFPSTGFADFGGDFSVNISYKPFSGWSPYDIAFIGNAGDSINEVWVGGKKVDLKNRNDLYFRRKIELAMGYNRVPVRIKSYDGREVDKYFEITVTRNAR